MLTAEQIEAYRRDGFLVLPELLEGGVLAHLRAACDEVIERQVRADGDRMLGGITCQVMFPAWAHPAFDRNPAVRQGLELAPQLLAIDEVHRSFDMLIYKPPDHPHATPWHQRRAILLSYQPAGRPRQIELSWVPERVAELP